MECIHLTQDRLREITEGIHDVNVCLIGDICMDFYWYADMKRSQLSRETPHFPLPVTSEKATPGAAGNVMNNIHALQPKTLKVVSCVGDDWRGQAVLSWMKDNGIETNFIHHRAKGITPAYCKPMKAGISDVVYEDPRIDFENFETLSPEDEAALIINIDLAVEDSDIIVVSDQFTYGVITETVRKHISEIGQTKTVVVDSRDRIGLYENVILKPNELEAARVLGKQFPEGMTEEDCLQTAKELKGRNTKPVIVTFGDKGAIWANSEKADSKETESQDTDSKNAGSEDGNFKGANSDAADSEDGCCKGANKGMADSEDTDIIEAVLVQTVKAEPPVDIVGAGDTFLSAFSCAYAAGAEGTEAVMFGNLASGVTVKKIGTTGTASAEEITELYGNCYGEKSGSAGIWNGVDGTDGLGDGNDVHGALKVQDGEKQQSAFRTIWDKLTGKK